MDSNKRRVDKDTYYLRVAKEVAKRSTCLKRKYGAVIVNNDEIISTGYNGAPRSCINCCDTGVCNRANDDDSHNGYNYCKSVHAEMNAIISASRKDMFDGTLYLMGLNNNDIIHETSGPCLMCTKMIINAGIYRVVYGIEEKDGIITYKDKHIESYIDKIDNLPSAP